MARPSGRPPGRLDARRGEPRTAGRGAVPPGRDVRCAAAAVGRGPRPGPRRARRVHRDARRPQAGRHGPSACHREPDAPRPVRGGGRADRRLPGRLPAMQTARKHRRIRFLLGTCFARQKEFDKAIAAWREYLAKHPAHEAGAEAQQAIIDTEFAAAAEALRKKDYAEPASSGPSSSPNTRSTAGGPRSCSRSARWTTTRRNGTTPSPTGAGLSRSIRTRTNRRRPNTRSPCCSKRSSANSTRPWKNTRS